MESDKLIDIISQTYCSYLAKYEYLRRQVAKTLHHQLARGLGGFT